MADDNNQPVSLREKILAADDKNTEIVEIPQWGVKVQVSSMSGKERGQMLKAAMNDKGDLDLEVLYPMLIVATVSDPDTGEKVFTTEDYDALNEKSGAALEHIGQVAARLSGMTEEAINAMGNDLSPATPTSMSTGEQPSTSQNSSVSGT